jgi:hypothetical protein
LAVIRTQLRYRIALKENGAVGRRRGDGRWGWEWLAQYKIQHLSYSEIS